MPPFVVDRGTGTEQVCIDAPRPSHEVAEASSQKVRVQRLRRDHHRLRGRVKPAQPRVGDADRKPDPRVHVFRESRVVRGREPEAVAEAEFARGEPQWSLGRDMHGVGREVARKGLEAPLWIDRKADLRIARTRDAAEAIGADRVDDVALVLGAAYRMAQRRDDAVDLRSPRISREQNTQAAPPFRWVR